MRSQHRLVVPALATAVLTYAVSQTALVPSLPAIERTLHTTPVGVTSLIAAFFVSGAATAGVVGRLGDMFGKRRLLIAVLVLFTLGAFAAAFITSLVPLVGARLVMGCAVGVFPLAFSIVRDSQPAERVPAAISLLGGFGAAGAVIGQTCGGLITDQLGFHWIFWIAVIMGVASIAAVVVLVPESTTRAPGRVDVLGSVLLAAGVGAPLVAISEASAWGWTGARALGLMLVGAAILTGFVLHERRQTAPVVDLATLRIPQVALANAATVLVGFGLFGSSSIISQFVQTPRSTGYGLGASATEAGLFFVPGLMFMFAGSTLIGRVVVRAGASRALALGAALGCTALTGLAVFHGTRPALFIWPSLLYAGVAFAFAAAPVLILGAVPAELRGQATAVNQIARNVGSAIGLQAAASIVTASAVGGRLPSRGGYSRAFGLEAVGAAGAVLLALAISSKPLIEITSSVGRARERTPQDVDDLIPPGLGRRPCADE